MAGWAGGGVFVAPCCKFTGRENSLFRFTISITVFTRIIVDGLTKYTTEEQDERIGATHLLKLTSVLAPPEFFFIYRD